MTDSSPDAVREELDQALAEAIESGASRELLRHALAPQNHGVLHQPHGEASVTGICEDTVCVQVRLVDRRVAQLAFYTNGCSATLACGSMATTLAQGQSVEEALRIDGAQILEALGGLPVEHTHCADLAANALTAAVQDAVSNARQPWKALYR